MAETRRDRRRHEMRARILDAAVAAFAEGGFDATTMAEIAERADVARATVFNHFPDKDALLTAYVERRRERLVAMLRTDRAPSLGAGTAIRDAFDLLAAENERDRKESRELVQAWLRTGCKANARSSERILADIVAAGQRRGELRGDVAPDLAGRLLFDAYIGTLVRWCAPARRPFPLAERLREVMAVIVAGLRPPA